MLGILVSMIPVFYSGEGHPGHDTSDVQSNVHTAAQVFWALFDISAHLLSALDFVLIEIITGGPKVRSLLRLHSVASLHCK